MLGNVRREWVNMLKILLISFKSTILRVPWRSVLLKYLRFPDQHIKRNIDTLKVLYGESLPQLEWSHYPFIYHFWLKRCPLSCTFHQKMVSLKQSLFFVSLQTALNALSLSFSFFKTVCNWKDKKLRYFLCILFFNPSFCVLFSTFHIYF